MSMNDYRALGHAEFLEHIPSGRIIQEQSATVPVFQPDPFVVAGAVNRATGSDTYRGITCHLPPPSVLELTDVIVTGYGLVACGDALLADGQYTAPRGELGTELFQSFAPTGNDRHLGMNMPLATEQFDDAVMLLHRGDVVYGHWLLEVLPRIPLVKSLVNDKTVFLVSNEIRPYQVNLLLALGIAEDQIVKIDRGWSYRCRRLLVPSLAHPGDQTLHPFATRAYDALRDWARETGESCKAKKVFLTRRSRADDPRQLWNLQQFEKTARHHGYHVVDPGVEPVSTQINLVAGAERIVGLAGSGMHNTVFAGPAASVLIIQPSHFLNRLQTAIAGIRGHRIGYLIGEAFSAFDKASWSGCFIADPRLLGHIDEYLM
jgi:hypothetical protein